MSSAAKEVDGTGTVDVSSSAAERLKTNQATSETLNENSAQQVTVILLCSFMDPKVIGQFQYRLNMSDANSQTSKILLIYNVFRALFNLQFTPKIREGTLLLFEYAVFLCLFSSLFTHFCFILFFSKFKILAVPPLPPSQELHPESRFPPCSDLYEADDDFAQVVKTLVTASENSPFQDHPPPSPPPLRNVSFFTLYGG